MGKTRVDEHLKLLGSQELEDIESSSDFDSECKAEHLFEIPMMVDGKVATKVR